MPKKTLCEKLLDLSMDMTDLGSRLFGEGHLYFFLELSDIKTRLIHLAIEVRKLEKRRLNA